MSIGMLEHVGKSASDGHVQGGGQITETRWRSPCSHHRQCRQGPRPNPWIDRHVFPGGFIPSLNQVTAAIDQTSLLVSDVETLRMHYAWTLNAWRLRFADAKRKIISMFGERFFRVWDFYLAISEASFRAGIYVNYQVQLTKGINSLPFTRDYMTLESHERKS